MSQGSREAPVPCGEKSLPSSSLFQGERDLAGTTGSAAFAPTLCLYGKKKKIRPQNRPEIQCLPRLKDAGLVPSGLLFANENAVCVGGVTVKCSAEVRSASEE